MSRRISASIRFFKYASNCNTVENCWEWKGGKTYQGYGVFSSDNRESILAHRWIWTYLFGPMPKNRVINHRCRNTSCVNPVHMEVISQSENVLVGDHYERKIMHCPRGHAYTTKNTYIQRRYNGNSRSCKICKAAFNAARPKKKAGWPTADKEKLY